VDFEIAREILNEKFHQIRCVRCGVQRERVNGNVRQVSWECLIPNGSNEAKSCQKED
jgi:hypothetical protein